MNNDTMRRVLADAVYAPSIENSQPWRFEVKENKIYVYNTPHKENPAYESRKKGYYFAHGGLIFNLQILLKNEGYDTEVSLMPNNGKDELIAVLNLKEGIKIKDELIDCVKTRSTNRKKYESIPLTSEQKNAFLKIGSEFPAGKIIITEDESKKERITSLLSLADRIMLEDKSSHGAIFANICWNENEEKEKKKGMYVKTMELAPPQFAIFKLLKNWKWAELFKKIGMTKFIAKENARLYKTGSALISIIIQNNDLDFIKAGMCAQKLWLKATQIGLHMQPLVAVPYLGDYVSNHNNTFFSGEHVSFLKTACLELRQIFGQSDREIIAMTLRTGKAESPSGTSSRKEPEIVFQN